MTKKEAISAEVREDMKKVANASIGQKKTDKVAYHKS